jgi:hypothetical protein
LYCIFRKSFIYQLIIKPRLRKTRIIEIVICATSAFQILLKLQVLEQALTGSIGAIATGSSTILGSSATTLSEEAACATTGNNALRRSGLWYNN